MNERLMELRKSEKLSRAAFGEKLGVSGDVINNIERGRVDLKEPMLMLIVKTFNVSEDWLKTGKGDMRSKGDAIRSLAQNYKLTQFQEALIRGIVEMDSRQRESLWNAFNKYLAPLFKDEEDYANGFTRSELHEKLDRQLDQQESSGKKSEAS